MSEKEHNAPARPSVHRSKDDRRIVFEAFACTFIITAFVALGVALVLGLIQAIKMVVASLVLVQ